MMSVHAARVPPCSAHMLVHDDGNDWVVQQTTPGTAQARWAWPLGGFPAGRLEPCGRDPLPERWRLAPGDI